MEIQLNRYKGIILAKPGFALLPQHMVREGTYSFLIPTQIKYVRKTETWWGAQGGGEGYVLSISTNLATFISASQYSSIRGKTIN